jgi:hypothetical protein
MSYAIAIEFDSLNEIRKFANYAMTISFFININGVPAFYPVPFDCIITAFSGVKLLCPRTTGY